MIVDMGVPGWDEGKAFQNAGLDREQEQQQGLQSVSQILQQGLGCLLNVVAIKLGDSQTIKAAEQMVGCATVPLCRIQKERQGLGNKVDALLAQQNSTSAMGQDLLSLQLIAVLVQPARKITEVFHIHEDCATEAIQGQIHSNCGHQ